MSRSVLALTGIRSEYDVLYPALDAIRNHEELSLDLLVSGAHVAETHGDTIDRVRQDGFEIADTIASLFEGDRKFLRAKGTGALVSSLSETVERESPDFLLAVGDREEPLAAAVIGNYLDIPVAHIFGGDAVWGNADDQVRHAVSKLAHIHLTACQEHRDRLVRMGEAEFRTFDVGNPALDRLRNVERLEPETLSETVGLDLDSDPFLVVLQHPLSSERQSAAKQMRTTMEAVVDLGFPTVVIHPNTDPGSSEMVTVIKQYRDEEFVSVHENFERDIFVNLLRHATALVGNSSAGFLEAPFLSLPAINIGNRQTGRTNAGNVQYVDHDVDEIVETVSELTDERERKRIIANTDETYYGDGETGERIAQILAEIDINSDLLIKSNRY